MDKFYLSDIGSLKQEVSKQNLLWWLATINQCVVCLAEVNRAFALQDWGKATVPIADGLRMNFPRGVLDHLLKGLYSRPSCLSENLAVS